ncbi:Uma2 family endonuclease [Streptomyces sp. SID3343]|uniref:Uma2 family endonuclease n=1 Tax=Streptomyces sp. SID3343 TaxID=2690260 RepID=UPI00136E37A2|nr:Uma2 family endonuclease [Streptomyces sp. SID3343]
MGEVKDMTAPVIETGTTWLQMVAMWQELDVPKGWRVEVDGENITVSPPPVHTHELIVEEIAALLRQAAPKGCGAFTNLGVEIVSLGRLYIPDLAIVPREDTATPTPADRALLVAEVTSQGNAKRDRETKRDAYAQAPVPLYLLIDRWDPAGPSVTLFSEPDRGKYRRFLHIAFGTTIDIPEPFGIELDTSNFPR